MGPIVAEFLLSRRIVPLFALADPVDAFDDGLRREIYSQEL